MLKPFFYTLSPEAGCDEAGRGCLAGPVVAAAVILSSKCRIPGLNDSKKLNKIQREALVPIIKQKALFWAIGICSPKEIDSINILNASFLAMHKALDQIPEDLAHIIVDGNRFKQYRKVPHSCIVKGDGKYMSIAAASILAKTHRDDIMMELHKDFPFFGWDRNKGYPTQAHRKAIAEFGHCKHHRMSFSLLPRQLKLFQDEKAC